MNAGDARAMNHFLRGMGLTVAVQTVFMGGGLLLERLLDIPVTGVPSAIGLTVLLGLGAWLARRYSEMLLIGAFTVAFLSPLILFLVVAFNVFKVEEKLVYFSLGYLSALILAVWFYFGFRILGGAYDDQP
jgi:hypothetical protein